MRRVASLCLTLALGLTVAGCTMSREFDGDVLTADAITQLASATTKAQVLTSVGPPNDVGLQLNGSVFIYRYRYEELDNLNLSFFRASFDYTAVDRRTARLVVFFDKRGQKTGQGFDSAGFGED